MTLELKESPVSLASQVLQVRWDIQAPKVPKDKKEPKVNTEPRGHRVSEVVRAQLAREVSQDLQALELKATEVLMEILGFLGL